MISPPNAEKTNTETDAKLHHIIKSRRKKSFATAAIKVKKEKGKTKKIEKKTNYCELFPTYILFHFFYIKKREIII